MVLISPCVLCVCNLGPRLYCFYSHFITSDLQSEGGRYGRSHHMENVMRREMCRIANKGLAVPLIF